MKKIFTYAMAGALLAGTFPMSAAKMQKRIQAPDEAWEIQYEQPEGDVKLYSRTCQALRELLGGVEYIIDEGSVVKVIEQEDGTVWMNNAVAMYALPGWIKGEKSGDYITITGPQLVYQEYDYDADDGSMLNYYLTAVEIKHFENEQGETVYSFRPTEDGKFRFKINGETLKEDGDGSLILGICGFNETEGYYFTGYGDQYTVMTIPAGEPIVLPASAEISEQWAMRYYDTEDNEGARLVDVAVDGYDYYLRNVYPGLPEAWIKGTREGDEIRFSNFQMLGIDEGWKYFIYAAGGTMTSPGGESYYDNAVLNDDGFVLRIYEDGTLEADSDLIFVTSDKTNPENANYVSAFTYVTMKPQDPNSITQPVGADQIFLGGFGDDPAIEFNLVALDENGNLLNTDNLYFSAYVNSEVYTFDSELYVDMWDLGIYEPTTELPYNITENGYDFYQYGAWHTVYIKGYTPDEIRNIGIQAIYYPEGREKNPENVLKSDIIMVGEDIPTSIGNVDADLRIASVSYLTLSGQPVANPTAGIYLKRIEYTDGSAKTLKTTVR